MVEKREQNQYEDRYLIHKLVFLKEYDLLHAILIKERIMKEDKYQHPLIDELDLRGYTSLHIAIMTNQFIMVKLLVEVGGASVLIPNKEGWSTLNEAVSIGNKDIIKFLIIKKQEEIMDRFCNKIPNIMHLFSKSVVDFKLELSWSMKSWVPLLSNFCPSDTYTIWKKGTKLRVDSTLIGFENLRWIRGKQSFIFYFDNLKDEPIITAIDRTNKIYKKIFRRNNYKDDSIFERDLENDIKKLDKECNEIASEKITKIGLAATLVNFKPDYNGLWNYKIQRKEIVNGYLCKVWKVENLHLKIKSRYEHLTINNNNNFINSISYYQYFDSNYLNSQVIHLGKPQYIKNLIYNLTSTIWFTEDHENKIPFELKDFKGLVSIISWYYPHLAKEIETILNYKTPKGFPIKAHIPFLPTVSLNLNFNLFDFNLIDDTIFDIPNELDGYTSCNNSERSNWS